MRRSAQALSFVLIALLSLSCTSTGSRSGQDGRQRSPALQAFTLQNEGSGFFQQGRHELALEKFQEADRLQPGNSTVHNMIGLCYLRMGQYGPALDAFTKALALTPAFTDARNNRGATYLAMQQFELAEVDFAAVLADSTYPHRYQAYYNLGMTYLQRGQLMLAEENMKRAATAASPIFEAFLRLADISREMGKSDDALTWLQEARLKFPERHEATLEAARILIEQQRNQEARIFLEEVIAADPRSDLAEQARGLLQLAD
jgi:Tfp pilus assembly protein PilF